MKFSLGSGGIGLPLDPKNSSHADAANRNSDFHTGYFANPLFLGQQVPTSLRDALGSKVPQYTDAELSYVHGTCDFFAFDLYTAIYVLPADGGIDACAKNRSNPAFPTCVNTQPTRAGWALAEEAEGDAHVSFTTFIAVAFGDATLHVEDSGHLQEDF